jgi:hypothetical protein
MEKTLEQLEADKKTIERAGEILVDEFQFGSCEFYLDKALDYLEDEIEEKKK